jgi:hypothetical protein
LKHAGKRTYYETISKKALVRDRNALCSTGAIQFNSLYLDFGLLVLGSSG